VMSAFGTARRFAGPALSRDREGPPGIGGSPALPLPYCHSIVTRILDLAAMLRVT